MSTLTPACSRTAATLRMPRVMKTRSSRRKIDVGITRQMRWEDTRSRDGFTISSGVIIVYTQHRGCPRQPDRNQVLLAAIFPHMLDNVNISAPLRYRTIPEVGRLHTVHCGHPPSRQVRRRNQTAKRNESRAF